MQLAQSIKLDGNLRSATGASKETGDIPCISCSAFVMVGEYPPQAMTDSQTCVKR